MHIFGPRGVVVAGLVCLLASCGAGATTGVVRVDPAQRFQTIQGWSASSQAGQDLLKPIPATRDAIADAAVDLLGIDRLRVQVRSGEENPVDSYALWREGKISAAAYRKSRYQAVNDDDDPHHERAGGFQFSQLDRRMQWVVLPIRKRLEARGEHLYVNLCYVDFGASSFEQYANPEEYAEFISVMFNHLRDRFGVTPDGVEVILEPDKAAGWTPDRVAQALIAASRRLAAEGFHPDFIAPSTSDARHADRWEEALLATPGVGPALKELSYHRYGIVLPGVLARIATRGLDAGLRTSMLEKIGANIDTLEEDLRQGMVSAWMQFTVAYPGKDDGSHYLMLEGDPPRIRLSKTARLLSEIFRNVRRGDVRIGAESTSDALEPLAFQAPGGEVVVAVRAHRAAQFEIRGLPAGRYVPEYTTAKQLAVQGPPLEVAAGGSASGAIPAAGVWVLRNAALVAEARGSVAEEAVRLSRGSPP